MSEALAAVSVAVSGFDERVQAASSDSWSNQSPCAEWKARDVVVHVANNLRGIAAGLGGTALGDVAESDDIVGAWSASRDEFLKTIEAADLDAPFASPMGPMPAGQFLQRIITMDTLIHTWDLARAVGGNEALNPQLVEAAYAGVKPMDAMIRRPGVFGDKVACPEGADLQTEFLTFLGRAV